MAIELEGIAPASGGEPSPGELTAKVFFTSYSHWAYKYNNHKDAPHESKLTPDQSIAYIIATYQRPHSSWCGDYKLESPLTCQSWPRTSQHYFYGIIAVLGTLFFMNSETMDSISLVTTPTTLNYGRIRVLLIVSLLPFSCGIGDFCCALFSFSSPDMHPLVELVLML
ncbi:hypothetical protein NC652_032368 [Populus alba x Populus x berolinensis]|nr:hypothetical protein NC652_032368 [Populus alba x Populus x berolinensis]